MSSADSPVGDRIREAREALGFTQAALGRELDQAERTVQAWELNERVPRMPALQRLAALSGRPLSFFFSDPGVPT